METERKANGRRTRRIVWTVIAIIAVAGLVVGGKQLRDEYYPVHVDPSPEWAGFVAALDATVEEFPIEIDGVSLEAELFIPLGGEPSKPAAVFSPGSGDSLYQNYAAGMIEQYVLEPFLARDMAVLLVNKRGMGNSEGDYTGSSIQGRADDLTHVMALLRSHPVVDPGHVGLIGHSEGGWVVAQAAADDPNTAFVISLAGPAVKRIEQATDMYTHEAACQGLSGDEATQYLEKRLRVTNLGTRIGRVINFGLLGFDARSMEYDPSEAIRQIQSPVLYAFAENDNLVTPSVNLERMDKIFQGQVPSHIELTVIDRATHIYRLVDAPCESWEDPTTKQQSTQLVQVIDDWLERQGY